MSHLTMKKLLLSFLIIFNFAACKTAKQDSKIVIDPLPLTTYFKNSDLPAALMGYSTKEGKTEWFAFGPSVWGGKDTINENNIFRIYSMTKAIASVAALQLVDKGLIDLDAPLDELMPEMTVIPILNENGVLVEAKKSINLRQLLTHTAGFSYSFMDQNLQKFDKTDWEYEDLPRVFEAGESWKYGTSLDWVGKIIEKVSGENLEDYLRKNVTGPLKMNSTWFNVPENLKENIVSWGTRNAQEFQEYQRLPAAPVALYSAGGGLFGSPKDYLTFLDCIMNNGKFEGGQLLKPETVAMMFTNQLPNNLTINGEELDTHSLAWAIENSEDEVIRSKGSVYWSGLANTYYSLDQEKEVTIVYFTNFFPFGEKETNNFYKLFQREVYNSLKAK
jgi:CubicO group peptidase (beta-lactamase class C family)